MSKPTDDPKVSRWWWRPLRTWVYGLVDPLWAAFRGENSDDIALSNVTSINGVSSTELTVLDGLTATTAELNLLAGLTATSAELNKADRSASDGLAEASRNLVLDANRDLLGKRFDINQSLLEAIAGGPSLWFNGTDDYVERDVQVVSGYPFVLLAVFRTDTTVTNILVSLMDKSVHNIQFYLRIASFGTVEIGARNTTNQSVTSTETYNDGKTHTALAIFRSATDRELFVDGASVASDTASVIYPSSVDRYSVGRFGDASPDQYFKGEIFLAQVFDRGLTADEVKAYSSGALPDYSEIGAADTDLVANGDDWTGATGSTPPNSWSDSGSASVTYILRDNTGVANMDDKVLEIDVSGSGSKTLSQGVFQTGKRYRVTFAYRNLDGSGGATKVTFGSPANSATLQNTTIAGDGIVFTQDVLADGPDLAFEVTTDGALQIDDVQVVQIGCVLALRPGGIGHLQWQDAGGNELHGTVTGAQPGRLPIDHVERYIRKGITADTTLTAVVPAGYRIRSIIVEETAGNAITGGLKIGTSAGGAQVVNAQAVGASALVDCALGARLFSLTTAQTLYVEDVTAWNSASIDLYLEMERIK
ncbi:MAG: hypothetical protein IID13_05950 [Candidatus Marinimicrobia bacterium]|nr:hypothetical protein [Candidatus Neomarinimicrobiota bacterium]